MIVFSSIPQTHVRNVEDRRRVIRDLKKAIRRKEIENQRMDTDLEEMAIKVAERQNVSNPNGKIALKTIRLYQELLINGEFHFHSTAAL